MKKHTITVEELEGQVVRKQIAGAFGDGENKSIDALMDVHSTAMFEVYDHGDLKHIGKDLASAVSAYNAIESR